MNFRRFVVALLSLGLLALSVQVAGGRVAGTAPALVAEDPKPGTGGG
jgi:hypothetical protein